MHKSALILFLLIFSISLLSCGSAAPSQSTFKKNFSLNSIVEANQGYLLEEARVSSGAEVGSGEQFMQRYEEIVLQIDPANVPAFIAAVRADIEEVLLDSGAHVLGSQANGNEHFSFSYSENDLYGTVPVWGVAGEGATYTIILLITEK